MARTVPIWSDAYTRWGGSPYNWQEWAPWYKPLTGRLNVTNAGPDVMAAEIYNQLLPFMHPRDMQKYLDSIIANDAASSEGQPLYSYRQFWSQDPNMAKNWTPPRRLTMSEEYGMSKADKIGYLADVLLGEAVPVSGKQGDEGPFERRGSEDPDSLVGGLLDFNDPIRPYVEALLRKAAQYAPGGNQVGSRRSLMQQADYEIQFQDALDALRSAEGSEGSPWGGQNYISNILEEVLQPGYYRNPAASSGAPAQRRYRYLFDQYRPYRSSYYY